MKWWIVRNKNEYYIINNKYGKWHYMSDHYHFPFYLSSNGRWGGKSPKEGFYTVSVIKDYIKLL